MNFLLTQLLVIPVIGNNPIKKPFPYDLLDKTLDKLLPNNYYDLNIKGATSEGNFQFLQNTKYRDGICFTQPFSWKKASDLCNKINMTLPYFLSSKELSEFIHISKESHHTVHSVPHNSKF